MKNYGIVFILLSSIVFSCTHVNQTDSAEEIKVLNAKVDSLNAKINSIEKDMRVGLGPNMLTVQTHHTKLGLAIEAQNWELCNFQITELEEDFIYLGHMYPSWDGFKKSMNDYIVDYMASGINQLEEACTKQDAAGMKKGYNLLTACCNSCHTETGKPFNVIVEPKENRFSDQRF